MADIPILGENKSAPEQDEGPSLDDLTPEQREQLAALAEEHGVEPEGQPVATAFIVAIGRNGEVVATSDVTLPVVPDRQATTDDMYGACSVVLKDITAQTAAATTQGLMVQMSRAIQEQQQQQQMLARLQQGDPKLGRRG